MIQNFVVPVEPELRQLSDYVAAERQQLLAVVVDVALVAVARVDAELNDVEFAAGLLRVWKVHWLG